MHLHLLAPGTDHPTWIRPCVTQRLVAGLALVMSVTFQPTLVGCRNASNLDGNQHLAETSHPSAALPTDPVSNPPLCPPAGLPMLQPSPITGHHKVILKWNASTASADSKSKAVGYCLYRSKMENIAKQALSNRNARCGGCEQINSVAIASTACVDDLVEDNATYHYVVTAINALGNTSSSSQEALARIPPKKQSASSVSASSYPLCRGRAARNELQH